MTAEERAGEMMDTPINQLPELANKYARALSKEIGGCGEVYFTAFAYYAQAVEGLRSDKSCKITKEAKEWFKNEGNI